ncbi:hypothetical protein FRT59_22365 [Pseudomonas haemolytica]|uniref:Uncharacterized protein n=1 Tax=Pseudomonas haemolytica TaxID=2600065 RepID=A0A5P1DGR0_9PSED|nr:hypothetical protein [Pseudomonas haemolytica]
MQYKCGSGLARESGVPGTESGSDTPLSRASPLPHFDWCLTQDWRLRGCAANFTPANPWAISARILPWSLPSGVATTER